MGEQRYPRDGRGTGGRRWAFLRALAVFALFLTLVQTTSGARVVAQDIATPTPDTTVAAAQSGDAGQTDPTPTVEPTETPTAEPTATPTEEPTQEPTATPTEEPTEVPTATPTATPAQASSVEPTATPTETPAQEPDAAATDSPTATATSTPVPTDGPPWIASDKDDYPPGARVTLTGGNWQPGEVVHVTVNDDQGQSWSRSVDVTADENGTITDAFNLPDWFVAVYTVKATGPLSGRVTTTFTDSRTINSVTLNGGTSVTVAPSSSIPAVISVTTAIGSGNSNWNSFSWRISTSPSSGSPTCVSNLNHNGVGTYQESFSVTAPSSADTYNAYFIAYTDVNCSSQPSETFTLTNAVIVKLNQTITFGALPDRTFGEPDFGVSASTNSGLTVSFSASGNCSVNGSTVHLTGAGSCTITASQAGNGTYFAAPDVPRSFTINKATSALGLAVSPPGPIDAGTSASATATFTGGYHPTGSVTYTVYTDSGCTSPYSATGNPSTKTIAGDYSVPASDSVTFAHKGTYYWQASYAGDDNNTDATSLCTALTVNPTISLSINTEHVDLGNFSPSGQDPGVDSVTITTDGANGATYIYTGVAAVTVNSSDAWTGACSATAATGSSNIPTDSLAWKVTGDDDSETTEYAAFTTGSVDCFSSHPTGETTYTYDYRLRVRWADDPGDFETTITYSVSA